MMTFVDRLVIACARYVHSTVELEANSALLKAVNRICNAGARFERSQIDLSPLIEALKK